MLTGLRRSGEAARANTKPIANAEPQRRDRSKSIDRIRMWKKLSRIQSETKGLETQKSPLSQYPLSRPLWRLERTGNGPIADSREEGAQH